MSRKSKQSKHKKKFTASLSPVDKYLDLIGHQIFQGNYAEAVATCERLLNYLPRHAPQRADVLAQLGTAQAMLQNFPQSYEAFTEALALERAEECRALVQPEYGEPLRFALWSS